jgi:hypothetical protein
MERGDREGEEIEGEILCRDDEIEGEILCRSEERTMRSRGKFYAEAKRGR